MIILLGPGLWLAAVLAGCAQSGQDTTSDTEISRNERLYRAKCGSCHRLIEPQEHDAQAWAVYVEKYGSGLTPEQRALILDFLIAGL